MDLSKLKFKTDLPPASGRILISEPTLPDQHFHRSVVYICAHNVDGSMGFILNRKLQDPLSFFIEDIEQTTLPLYVGGPVSLDTVHFIHTKGKLLGGELVMNNIYHGGDFEYAISLLKNNKIGEDEIKFFLGYSGWDKGQLEGEINGNSWLVGDVESSFLFSNGSGNLWKDAILNLDKEYHNLLKMPANPGMN